MKVLIEKGEIKVQIEKGQKSSNRKGVEKPKQKRDRKVQINTWMKNEIIRYFLNSFCLYFILLLLPKEKGNKSPSRKGIQKSSNANWKK